MTKALTRRALLRQLAFLGAAKALWAPGALGRAAQPDAPLVGVSYYVWYRSDLSNWNAGHLHTPLLGTYRSDDEAVMGTHLDWMREFGVDVLFVSWMGWEGDADLAFFDRNLQRLLAHPALFETQRWVGILYESAHRLIRNERGEIDFDLPDNVARLVADFDYLARYFSHPRFLRLEGRPAVYLYETLAYRGAVVEAFSSLRQHLVETTGQDPFFISSDAHPLAHPQQFSPERIRLFDGISQWAGGYRANGQYPGGYPAYWENGNAVWSAFALREGLAYVPSVVPGFDQTAVSWGDPNSVPLPRDLEAFGRRLARAGSLQGPIRLLRVDTWNDFFEHTQIEPSRQEQRAYLEALGRWKAAVSG